MVYKWLQSKIDLPTLQPLRFMDLCCLNLGNDVDYYSFDTGIVYLLSISSDGTVSEVCGPVCNGSVGAGIFLIEV